MLWNGGHVLQEEDEEAVTINQGVEDIRFTNILQLFSIYFFFFNYFTLSLFSILFLPTTFTHTHDPRPTTHDPRPLPTTHDPGHLATLLFTSLFSFPPETPHTQARYTLLGTLRWHDGENKNENENVKQAMGWISKTTTLHVHHAYLYISLQIMHDNDGKMPNLTFYGGCKQATAKFSFSFWTWIRFLGIRLNKSSLAFDKVNHELEKSRWYWKNANSLFLTLSWSSPSWYRKLPIMIQRLTRVSQFVSK